MDTIKIKFLAILAMFFCIHQSGNSQEVTEKELIKEIDSLYRVLFTFNYNASNPDDSLFVAYTDYLEGIIDQGLINGHKGAFYKGTNVLFLHTKYQDLNIEAKNLLDDTIEFAKAEGDSLAWAQNVYFIGNLFNGMEEYDSSIYYFEESLKIASWIESASVQAASVNAIAVTYAQLDRDDLALDFYKQSLELAKLSPDSTQVLTAYGNLATVYGRMGYGDSTMYYARIAFDLSEAYDEPAIRWHALNSLTVGSFLLGKHDEAITYANQLRSEVTPIEELGFLITSHLFRSKSLAAKGQSNQSLFYARESLRLAKEYQIKTNTMRALEWLIELTTGVGNYKTAFEYQKEIGQLQDSLSNISSNKRIDALAARYESREKEQEIKSLNRLQKETQDKARIQNWLLIAAILGLIMLVILLYVIFSRRVEREQIEQQKAKNELLRTQMNPHFLFNALSSIQLFLINKGQESNALDYLSKFAKLIRRILENSRKDFVSLEDEVATLRHYLDLQKIRFDNRFDYKLDVSIEDNANNILIPPMFAQPFIENSLEHGIGDRSNGLIEISFKQNMDKMVFTVQDNGVGLSKAMEMKKQKGDHESLATRITKDRLDLLKKQYRKNIYFNVKDRFSSDREIIGTQVIFELPIEFKV